MPTARVEAAAASVNGIVYVVGGKTSAYADPTSVNEAYNASTNSWSTRAPIPYGVRVFGIAAVNGRVYVIGGLGAGGAILSRVEAYNPSTNTWSSRAAMPTPRAGLAAFAINGIIYAVGGYNGTALNTVEAYNPSTNAWSTKAPMPTPRYGLGACAINGILYAVGGRPVRGLGSNQFAAYRYVETYNPVTNAWSKATPMSTGRAFLVVGVVNNRLFAIGGTSILTIFGYSGSNSVEIFNPSTAGWSAGPTLPTSLVDSTLGVTGGSLFVAGGWNRTSQPPLNSLYALTP